MAAEHPLPIHRLTLYKHGVCFVQRQGTLDGDEVRLVFRASEVNDALKSLLVIDGRGGQVRGISYDTPADRQARLADSPIALSDDHSLLDLLRGLRGVRVRIATGEGMARQELRGQLLGIELLNPEAPLAELLVAILDEASGAVRVLPLQGLQELAIDDARARQDLAFFLDSSREEAAHRTVTVQLEPGEHDLYISYLVPSPVWRISYRLVAESGALDTDGGEPLGPGGAASDGQLLLQGWGLFDNRLEEDLHEVEVSLVAGQPISFVYDLAGSRIPDRPFVAELGRVAAAPVEFQAALAQAPMRMAPSAPVGAAYDVPTLMRDRSRSSWGAELEQAAASIESLAGTITAAIGSEQGELFAYEVAAPVTVRRGASALVPVLNARLPYRRELLFNERKLHRHPVAALRFANAAGTVLERGPVTVLERGEYRGEAIVPFTKEGAEVYLAYAVELGIAVTLTTTGKEDAVGIHLADAVFSIRRAAITTTSYRLENTMAEARTVIVEHQLTDGLELVETPDPLERTAEHVRWSVACAPRQAATFVVRERRHYWAADQLFDQSYADLHGYLQARWLDQATLARITGLLDERRAIAGNAEERQKLDAEREGIYEREESLRQNMAALRDSGEEGALRRQTVAQLQAAETRIAAIDARLVALAEDSRQRQARIEEELRTLRVG